MKNINFFLYDGIDLITHTFFTEVNKKIQSYGMISIQFNRNTQTLINAKNMFKFNILNNVKQESIMLQLENILKPEKIKTVDSKITNFSILSIEKQNTCNRKRRMQKQNKKKIDEFKIEGLQNFNQYLKINPVAVQIIESQIQNKLLFYSKNYKYRFIIFGIKQQNY